MIFSDVPTFQGFYRCSLFIFGLRCILRLAFFTRKFPDCLEENLDVTSVGSVFQWRIIFRPPRLFVFL